MRYQKLHITHDCLISCEDLWYRCCGMYPCKSTWFSLIQTNCVGEAIDVGEANNKRGREVEAKHILAEVDVAKCCPAPIVYYGQ